MSHPTFPHGALQILHHPTPATPAVAATSPGPTRLLQLVRVHHRLPLSNPLSTTKRRRSLRRKVSSVRACAGAHLSQVSSRPPNCGGRCTRPATSWVSATSHPKLPYGQVQSASSLPARHTALWSLKWITGSLVRASLLRRVSERDRVRLDCLRQPPRLTSCSALVPFGFLP